MNPVSMMRVGVVVLMATLSLVIWQSAEAIGTLEDATTPAPQVATQPSGPAIGVRHPVSPTTRILNSPVNDFDAGPALEEIPETVDVEAFPWTVSVVTDGKNPQASYLCGGVVVDPQWVLTVASCVRGLTRRWPHDIAPVVVMGTPALDRPGRQFAIEEVVLNPKFDARTLASDLALLRLHVKDSRAPLPIRLEGPAIAEQAGAVAQIVGWGASNLVNLTKGNKDQLQLIQTLIQDEAVCFSSPNHPSRRKTGAFCAQSALKHHDTCVRFEGSPIVLHDKEGARYLGGLVSATKVCPPDDRRPNIYVDVQPNVPWIRSVIKRQVDVPK